MIENASTDIDHGAVTLQCHAIVQESIVMKGETRELLLEDLEHFVQAARAGGFDSGAAIDVADDPEPFQPPKYRRAFVLRIARSALANNALDPAPVTPAAVDADAVTDPAPADGAVHAAPDPVPVTSTAVDAAAVADPAPATLSELGRA